MFDHLSFQTRASIEFSKSGHLFHRRDVCGEDLDGNDGGDCSFGFYLDEKCNY